MDTSRPIIKTSASNWKAFKKEFENFEEFLAEFERLSKFLSGPALRGALILNLFDTDDILASLYISKPFREKFPLEHKTLKAEIITQFTNYEIGLWSRDCEKPIDDLIPITYDTCLTSVKYFFPDVEIEDSTIMTTSYYRWMKIRKWLTRDNIRFTFSAFDLQYSIKVNNNDISDVCSTDTD
jgi:hypothetical protein